MSLLSADRQNYFVNKITEDFLRNKWVSAPDRDFLFQRVRIAFSQFIREWEELETEAEKKVRSIKRGVVHGTAEWDLLFSKYLEESFRKKSVLFVKK